MDVSSVQIEIIKGFITLIVTSITLIFGWLVGNKLSYEINFRQKRREIDLNISNQYFQLYGEFYAIWKVYNYLLIKDLLTDERHLEILKRAMAAEAGIEAIIIKIASVFHGG